MPEPIVTLNEESLRADPRELVRRTVEEMLNGLLDEEAGDLVGAERYERTADREAYRAGHYERKLATTSGEVTIRMPKLKGMRFTTAIIERYRRRETSVEEAMIETYLAGVSTRRIEDVSEIPWGSSVSAATVSNLNEKAFAVELDQAEEVKVFAKLPDRFKIDTPLGSYNPDWAYVVEKDGEHRVYFVTETKGGGNNDIRVSKKEDTKIRCARKHFEAIGSPDLEYNVRTTYHSIGF